MATSVAVHPSGKFAYASDTANGVNPASVDVFSIGAETGVLTPLITAALEATSLPQAIIIDSA